MVRIFVSTAECIISAFVKILLLHLMFLVCWGPYALQSLAGVAGLGHLVPLALTVLPLQFAKSSAVISPLIYVVSNSAVSSNLLGWQVICRLLGPIGFVSVPVCVPGQQPGLAPAPTRHVSERTKVGHNLYSGK